MCLLQETSCTKGFDGIVNKGWNGEIVHSYSPSAHSKGVSILFAKSLVCNIYMYQTDCPFVVCGDFNGRVGNLKDFIDGTDQIPDKTEMLLIGR